MYRVRGKFVKRSRLDHLSILSRSMSTHHACPLRDHNYGPNVASVPDISSVDHEEFCRDNENLDWREGRIIVELGVLADELAGCKFCGLPLSLSHTLYTRSVGLASVIYLRCSNTNCQKMNTVSTGKKHGKVYDVNSKAATAMIHAGIGERQLNSILGALNIKNVGHKTLDARQTEVGTVIEEVAMDTVNDSLLEEASLDQKGKMEIVASVDAGWQKRGSGRAYNSLSGHCTMIGCETGKVVGYAARVKQCRKCEMGDEEHDCRKNWSGSSKGMESDMVLEMVKKTAEFGVRTSAIVGDEDSSTIAKIRSFVDSSIEKISDKNHLKKTFSNSLYKLRPHFPTLTPTVINSFVKNFNYMLSQNAGNESGIIQGLDAVISHPFGDHSSCGKWCNFVTKKKASYSSLPYGKPLNDLALKSALSDLVKPFQKHAKKLIRLGSTQGNESLNRIISSKAPKTHHYSSSASFNFRLAAGIAQKNLGESYVLDVHRRIGLSHGCNARRSFLLRDLQRKKRKAVATTAKAKRRRIVLKNQSNGQEECLNPNVLTEGLVENYTS